MNAVLNVSEFVLTGLDGSNPLGFLAALGALRALDLLHPENTLLSWSASRNPILQLRATALVERGTLAEMLTEVLSRAASHVICYQVYPADIIKISVDAFRRFSQPLGTDKELSTDHRLRLALAAGFGSDAVATTDKPPAIKATRLSLANGNGGKKLLAHFRAMVSENNPPADVSRKSKKETALAAPQGTLKHLVEEAIFDGVLRVEDADAYYTFRWDPAELRGGAHLASKPDDTPMPSAPGANLLAVLGTSMLPVVPRNGDLSSTGFFRLDGREVFSWPLWSCPLSLDSVLSLLTLANSPKTLREEWSTARGVVARFAVERFKPSGQNNVYFGAPFSV